MSGPILGRKILRPVPREIQWISSQERIDNPALPYRLGRDRTLVGPRSVGLGVLSKGTRAGLRKERK